MAEMLTLGSRDEEGHLGLSTTFQGTPLETYMPQSASTSQTSKRRITGRDSPESLLRSDSKVHAVKKSKTLDTL